METIETILARRPGQGEAPAIQLRGQLVTLRPLLEADAEITWKWRQSERAKYLNRGAATVAAQQAWIAAHRAANELNLMIEYQAAPVGMIALHDINRQHLSAILGRLLIGDSERVSPIPVAFIEAEVLLCDYAFAGLGLHKIHGYVLKDNHSMVRLRAYMGYHQDGLLRDHFRAADGYHDMLVISLLEDEYWTICRPKLATLIERFTHSAYPCARPPEPHPEVPYAP